MANVRHGTLFWFDLTLKWVKKNMFSAYLWFHDKMDLLLSSV